MDFNKISRVVIDQISINHTRSLFNLGLQAGESVFGFSLLPESVKVLRNMLNLQIEAYEKAHGEIDISGTESGIQSPIQLS